MTFGYKSRECVNMINISPSFAESYVAMQEGLNGTKIDWILTEMVNIELGKMKWMNNWKMDYSF